MTLASYTLTHRENGKLLIEIPESRILAAATGLLHGGAAVQNPERLLDYIAAHISSLKHTTGSKQEPVIDQLIAEILAEAAHANAGIEWTNSAEDALLRQ